VGEMGDLVECWIRSAPTQAPGDQGVSASGVHHHMGQNGARFAIVRAGDHAASPLRLEDHLLHAPAFAYFYALASRIIQHNLVEMRALDVIRICPREVLRVLRSEKSYLLPTLRHATDDPLLRHKSGRLDLRGHIQAIPELPQRREQRLTGMEPWEALPFQDEH